MKYLASSILSVSPVTSCLLFVYFLVLCSTCSFVYPCHVSLCLAPAPYLYLLTYLYLLPHVLAASPPPRRTKCLQQGGDHSGGGP